MARASNNKDDSKLERLARELVEAGAQAGAVIDRSDRAPRAMAFIFPDSMSDGLLELIEQLDLTLPFSADSLSLLEALSQIAADNKRLKELTLTDDLTGLYNSRYFEDALGVEIERSKRDDIPFCLIMIDLDKFKPVNDTHGHQKGSEILSLIGGIIQENVRLVDSPIRYGGDEFSIILHHTTIGQANRMAGRLREKIESDPKISPYGVTASFGLAAYTSWEQDTAQSLIDRADKALYQAKEKGGNQVCFIELERAIQKPTEITIDERDSLYFNFSDEED